LSNHSSSLSELSSKIIESGGLLLFGSSDKLSI
jgi:hypothetical protein